LADVLRGRYRVLMIRTGDISLSPDERAGLANHAGSRLMISIHAGAAIRPSVSGCRVYYHQATPESSPTAAGSTVTPWRRQQAAHIDESRRLAALTADRLRAGTTEPAWVQPAPLAVLAGADMPAVVVEIGHITNPADEQHYTDPIYQVRVVQAMVWAINDFFDGRTAIISEDLKE